MNLRKAQKTFAKAATVFSKLDALSETEDDDRLRRAQKLVGEYMHDLNYEIIQKMKK